MRIFAFVILAAIGISAHGQTVECSNTTEKLIYDAKALTIGAPDPVKISGEVLWRLGPADESTVFTYPLADGRVAEITWGPVRNQTLPGFSQPDSAVIKKDGAVIASYPNCRWGR